MTPKHNQTSESTAGSDTTPLRFACDICGATTSRRGRLFTSEAEVLRHRTHMHPETKSSARAHARKPETKVRPRKVRVAGESAHAKFCPQCGFNLSVISAALTFVANQEDI